MFSYKIGLDIQFNNALERKQAFVDYNKVILKKVENVHSLKGLIHDFGQKFEIFLHVCLLPCVFCHKLCVDILLNVLERKQAFLNY